MFWAIGIFADLIVGATGFCHHFERASPDLSAGPQYIQEVGAWGARRVSGRVNVISWN